MKWAMDTVEALIRLRKAREEYWHAYDTFSPFLCHSTVQYWSFSVELFEGTIWGRTACRESFQLSSDSFRLLPGVQSRIERYCVSCRTCWYTLIIDIWLYSMLYETTIFICVIITPEKGKIINKSLMMNSWQGDCKRNSSIFQKLCRPTGRVVCYVQIWSGNVWYQPESGHGVRHPLRRLEYVDRPLGDGPSCHQNDRQRSNEYHRA